MAGPTVIMVRVPNPDPLPGNPPDTMVGQRGRLGRGALMS